MPKHVFEYTSPASHGDADNFAYVRVDDKFTVNIFSTPEGIIVDVCDYRANEVLATAAVQNDALADGEIEEAA